MVNFTPPAALPPKKKTPLPTEYEAGWAPKQVWTFRRREKCGALAGIAAADRPAISIAYYDSATATLYFA